MLHCIYYNDGFKLLPLNEAPSLFKSDIEKLNETNFVLCLDYTGAPETGSAESGLN